jgi:formiminotetrahydrofolate cyclodeaminase
MGVFTSDELIDLGDAVANLIQDKRDYCRFDEGVEDQIKRLEELKKKLESLSH